VPRQADGRRGPLLAVLGSHYEIQVVGKDSSNQQWLQISPSQNSCARDVRINKGARAREWVQNPFTFAAGFPNHR